MSGTKKSPFTVRELTYIDVFAVMLAVCSWLSIPFEIPVTLQTFGIFVTLELLGGRRGLTAVTVFLLLGAVGIPVFAGFTGGLGILFGTTGGYMLGFLIMAAMYWAAERLPRFRESIVIRGAVMLAGLLICYVFGTVWFLMVYTEDISVTTALKWCVIPFIIPDIIKLGLALAVSGRLRKYVRL